MLLGRRRGFIASAIRAAVTCYSQLSRSVASLLITEVVFISDFGPFSGFENWSSRLLSSGNVDFYRATRMYSEDYAVARCLSVCPSATDRYSVNTAERILQIFYNHVAPPF